MAKSFSGTSQDVTFSGLSAFGGAAGMTLSMWYRNQQSGTPNVGGVTGVKYTVWNVRQNIFNAGNIMWQCGLNGTEYGYTAAGTFNVGDWHHLGIIYDGSQSGNAGRLKIYRDLVSQSLTFNSTIPAVLGTDPRAFTIGRTEAVGNGQFDFAYLKLWVGALTLAQLTIEASSRKIIYQTGKQAWVPGDEPGNFINDYAGVMPDPPTPGAPGRIGIVTGTPGNPPPPPGVSGGGASAAVRIF